MYCKYCNKKEFSNSISLSNHERTCKKKNEIKDKVIQLYCQEKFSIRKITAETKITHGIVYRILVENDVIRNSSDALSLFKNNLKNF